jgi:hypothetical protein
MKHFITAKRLGRLIHGPAYVSKIKKKINNFSSKIAIWIHHLVNNFSKVADTQNCLPRKKRKRKTSTYQPEISANWSPVTA